MQFFNHILCFDFDGTIVDTAEIKLRSFLKLFNNLPKEEYFLARKILQENQGLPREKKFIKIYAEVFNEEISKEKLSCLSTRLDSLIRTEEKGKINLLGDIDRFLQIYHKEILFFIASAAPRSEIIFKLKKVKLLNFFEKVSGSEKTKHSALKEIIKKYNCDRENIFMIGDGLSDYNAALKAGVNFIAFGENIDLKRRTKKSIDNFFQLKKILDLNC